MKQMKKLASFILALAMVLGLSVSASAADHNLTLPDETGHTYEVYQIFTGDYSNGVLSNIKWGQNGAGAEGEAVDSGMLEELATLTGTDAEKLAVIEKYVSLPGTPYATGDAGEMVTVADGYYLIKDVDNSVPESSAYTLYVVQVVGSDTTISAKSSVPTVEKKVRDFNDSTGTSTGWQDSADYAIGDSVTFQLTGTLPSNYADYETYTYIFHDTLSSGLTFNKGSVVVSVDGTAITSGYTVNTDTADGCTFEVVFSDLKKVTSVTASSKITVEYSATLNGNAVLGSAGNPNTVSLEYSNNPNNGGSGDTGETPKDKVVVFTYKVVVDKVNENDEALSGAAFALEKFVAYSYGAETYNGVQGDWVTVSTTTADDTATSFTFTGLDEGEYRLVETETPDGYNTIEDIYFTIYADHETESDDPQLIELYGDVLSGETTFTADTTAGSLTGKVVNKPGSNLPSTGGMGTTVLYAAGGILVAGAALALILRRRSSGAEK